jgi:5-methylcytosine-specific restriction endonuclease McrA
MARQDGKCAHCSCDFNKQRFKCENSPETDHIIPIFQGGQSLGLENVQLLCKKCHRVKTTNERRKNG